MAHCSDLMTTDPTCCISDNNVRIPARMMRDENVGSIPVMESGASKRLIGIITDRDLALRVIAEDRNPDETRVGEVMSTELVTCMPDDDISVAMKKMQKHQVRRIPIVDEKQRIVGIIAQADIAREQNSEATGQVVEDISEPAS